VPPGQAELGTSVLSTMSGQAELGTYCVPNIRHLKYMTQYFSVIDFKLNGS